MAMIDAFFFTLLQLAQKKPTRITKLGQLQGKVDQFW
jgi:hypothetical protein